MKSAAASLQLIAMLAAVPLFAQDLPDATRATLVSMGGDRAFPVPIKGQAVGFAMSRPQQQVAIAARLGNGGGHAYYDAYLTKKIGPEATEADEIARITLDLPYPYDDWVTLFSDLELEQGVYWLIIAKPRDRAHSSINWFVANPGELRTACGMGYFGAKAYTFFGDAAEYLPASKFEKKFESSYGFSVRGDGRLDTGAGSVRWRFLHSPDRRLTAHGLPRSSRTPSSPMRNPNPSASRIAARFSGRVRAITRSRRSV